MYILEGNIGVGKSTFLSLIRKNLPEIEVVTEPVDNWATQIFGQSLLKNFYKNPSRWAYTLENLAMIYRVKDHIHQQKKAHKKVVMERSIYSGHYCFAINGYHSGYFSELEWNIYNKWASFLLKGCHPPIGFIYLKADKSVCFDRIQKRGRESEKSISLDYLEKIEIMHEKLLIDKEGVLDSIKNTPVLIVNCNQDFCENKKNLEDHLFNVKQFIEKNNHPKKSLVSENIYQ